MNSRDLTVVLLVILGLLVLLPVVGMTMGGFGMMGPGMMGGWGMMGRGVGGFGLLTFLLLVAGVVLIVLAFTRREGRQPDGAIEILKQRLARGEITREQYEELKQALQ